MTDDTITARDLLAAVEGAEAFRPVGAATRARMDAAGGWEAHSYADANRALGTPAAYYRVLGAEPGELDETACLMRLTWEPAEAQAALAAMRAEIRDDPTFEESAAAYLAGFDPAQHHLFLAYDPDNETPVGYVRWQCGLSVYDGAETEAAPAAAAAAADPTPPRLVLSVYPELFYVPASARNRRVGAALAGAIQAEMRDHVGDVLAAMAQARFPGPLAVVFFAEVESEGGGKLIEAIAESLGEDLTARHAEGAYGPDVPPIEVSLEHRHKQTP